MRENDPVAVAASKASETETPTVRVTEKGFEPASLTLPAGHKAQVTFLRTTDSTCGTEVIFPELKLRKALPLNQPVTIELPAHSGHSLKFHCGMDMLRGTVVVR
ncbi:cupredoxin domain-containing protein [bacterium CPR1]|nr:cupredoxin domain-containing protein [bacterium CPR1]